MKLAVPDMISNSYFPAIAAIELGCFKQEGLDVELELIFPVDKSYAALRDGTVDFVGGSAHSALAAFPRWQGAKLLCAQGQGMYWFLVMHKDFGAKRGDLGVVKGRSIGAAPWVEMGLRRLLIEAGIDLARDDVKIAPVPGTQGAGVNFGVTAAKALEERKIDGFWANGMGTEVAVRRGVGTVVLDVSNPRQPLYLGRTHGPTADAHSAWLGRNGLLAEAHETTGGVPTFYRRTGADPVLLGSFELPDSVINEGHRQRGLSPVQGLDIADSVHDAKLQGNLALFSWYSQGVVAADITNAARPRFLARFLPRAAKDPEKLLCPGRRCVAVWGVDVDGDLVVASDLNGGLWVLRLRQE